MWWVEEIDCRVWETSGFWIEELDIVAEKPGKIGVTGRKEREGIGMFEFADQRRAAVDGQSFTVHGF